MPTSNNTRPSNRGKMSTRSKLSIFAFLFCLLAAVVSGAHCGGYSCLGGGGKGARGALHRHRHRSPVEELFWAHATPTYFKASSSRFSSQFSYRIHEDDDEITLTLSLPGYSAETIDLTLNSKTELGATERVLVVSPADSTQGEGFAPTSFTIDRKVDASTISSSMKNGILTIIGRKSKPEVSTVALPIRVDDGDDEVKEEEVKAEEEPASPNDSPGVKITVDEDQD
mmetsp:Transcript_30817/g.61112  ORF Transcript_30817/g.61112 Transcript_30817/m.61112 type:complete len:227 (+) Transcript_30817:403-1083(+)